MTENNPLAKLKWEKYTASVRSLVCFIVEFVKYVYVTKTEANEVGYVEKTYVRARVAVLESLVSEPLKMDCHCTCLEGFKINSLITTLPPIAESFPQQLQDLCQQSNS